MSSEIAKAYVGLLPAYQGGASGIESQLRGPAESAGRTTGSRFGKVFASASMRPIRAIGTAALGLFAADKVKDFLASSIDEARESQKVSALTTQVIKSTGGAAQVSAKQVGNLASAISKKVGIDDEAIQSGANLLLTFKGIRNEAGAGNKIFDQSVKITTDLAASLAAASGGEVNFRSAATLVGKALNDPLKGMTALTRVGVTFNDQQQKQIKSLVASGKSMQAQKVILKELRSEFGGAAAATATAGDKMKVAWGNLQEQVGTAVLPVLDKAEGEITNKLVPAVSKFITQMQTGKGAGGDFADVLGEIADDAKKIASVGVGVAKFFSGLPGPLKSIAVEGGIAALVFPRLAAGVTFATTAIKNQITYARVLRLELAESATATGVMTAAVSRMGGALTLVAGVGGMVAMTQASKTTDQSLKDLENAAGAAAIGFSVGGPWGAAIGGGAGLLVGLVHSIKASTQSVKINYAAIGKTASVEAAKEAYSDLRSTLNTTTGAYTKNTRAAIENWLQTTDAGKKVRAELAGKGVSDRTIIESVLGDPAANVRTAAAFKQSIAEINSQIKAVKAQSAGMSASDLVSTAQGKALVAQANALEQQKTELVANRGAFTGYRGSLKQAEHDQRNFYAATQPIPKLLKLTQKSYESTFTKKVRGELKLDGVPKTLAGIKEVAKNAGGLTKHEWKVLLKAAGIDTTAKQLTGLAKTSNNVKAGVQKDSKAAGSAWSVFFGKGAASGKGKIDTTLSGLITTTTSSAKSKANSSSVSLGANYGQGYVNGINSKIAAARTAGFSLGNAAKQGTQSAQQSNSPSRVAHKLGGDFGTGYGNGLRDSMRKTTSTAGRSMKNLIGKFHGLGSGAVAAFSSGITGSENEAGKAVDKMMAAISKAIVSKKNKDGISKAAAQAMRRVVKEISKEATALRSTIGKRKSLVGDIASSLSGELDFASLISSDANTFGFTSTGSASSIVAGAQSIVARLKTFAVKLRALSKAGMPAALLQEITGLGSTDGLKVANAFLADKGEIKQLKSAYNQIGTYSKSIGSLVGDATYGQKIRQQQGQLDAMLGKHQKHQAKDIGKAVSDALRATPMVLEIDGKQTGRIYLAGKHNAAKYA